MTEVHRPKFDLEGQTVLVTGAARGIGRTIALACAASGANVALGLRQVETGKPLVAEIEATGRRALAVQMDVRSLDQIASATKKVHGHFGRIDVLVNNAGLGPENRVEDVNEADFDLTFDVNVKGTFFTSQAVGRLMLAQKSGRIVNISSQAGSNPLIGEAVYCASKAAIDHFTRCMAREWAPFGISAHVHLDRRHQAGIIAATVPRGHAGSHSHGPDRRTAGSGECRGVPRLARRLAHHRGHSIGRRWLEYGVTLSLDSETVVAGPRPGHLPAQADARVRARA
jgi:NADP-dependent 3-hydroxy acid dehydrogenase YdfG